MGVLLANVAKYGMVSSLSEAASVINRRVPSWVDLGLEPLCLWVMCVMKLRVAWLQVKVRDGSRMQASSAGLLPRFA